MRELAAEAPVLRKRLQRLLGENGRKAASEISTVILPQLKKVGKLVLFGGAVRDVARLGVRLFRSDLDFVLYDGDVGAFEALMTQLAGPPNRFGGFSIRYERWKVDIWALEKTWARTAGLRSVSQIQDLLACTFFDWDAILYNLETRAILARPGYFDALDACVMDINLEENPNPTGSLVRALRRGALWHVRFGPKLTAFVQRRLDQTPWDELVAIDQKAFVIPVLRYCNQTELRRRLAHHLAWERSWVTEPFGAPKHQLCFL